MSVPCNSKTVNAERSDTAAKSCSSVPHTDTHTVCEPCSRVRATAAGVLTNIQAVCSNRLGHHKGSCKQQMPDLAVLKVMHASLTGTQHHITVTHTCRAPRDISSADAIRRGVSRSGAVLMAPNRVNHCCEHFVLPTPWSICSQS